MNQLKLKLAGVAVVLAMASPVVMRWEGFKVTAYQDTVGIWTICSGHTGPDIKRGSTATAAQCEAYTKQDLETAYNVTYECVPGSIPNSVRAAYTSFTYNVGRGAAGVKDGMCRLKSGGVPGHVRLLNAGEYVAACQRLNLWVNAGGVPSKGITNRRHDEVALCLKDVQ